jgi:hypothetical protein
MEYRPGSKGFSAANYLHYLKDDEKRKETQKLEHVYNGG